MDNTACKLAPPLYSCRLTGTAKVQAKTCYSIEVVPSITTLAKGFPVSRPPYTVLRKFDDFVAFSTRLSLAYPEYAEVAPSPEDSDALTSLTPPTSPIDINSPLPLDSYFAMRLPRLRPRRAMFIITKKDAKSRSDDLEKFISRLFQLPEVITSCREVREFFGIWKQDLDQHLAMKVQDPIALQRPYMQPLHRGQTLRNVQSSVSLSRRYNHSSASAGSMSSTSSFEEKSATLQRSKSLRKKHSELLPPPPPMRHFASVQDLRMQVKASNVATFQDTTFEDDEADDFLLPSRPPPPPPTRGRLDRRSFQQSSLALKIPSEPVPSLPALHRYPSPPNSAEEHVEADQDYDETTSPTPSVYSSPMTGDDFDHAWGTVSTAPSSRTSTSSKHDAFEKVKAKVIVANDTAIFLGDIDPSNITLLQLRERVLEKVTLALGRVLSSDFSLGWKSSKGPNGIIDLKDVFSTSGLAIDTAEDWIRRTKVTLVVL